MFPAKQKNNQHNGFSSLGNANTHNLIGGRLIEPHNLVIEDQIVDPMFIRVIPSALQRDHSQDPINLVL